MSTPIEQVKSEVQSLLWKCADVGDFMDADRYKAQLDAIETLETTAAAAKKRVEELEEALRPFAKEAKDWAKCWGDHMVVCTGLDEADVEANESAFTLGDLRRAAAVLGKDKDNKE